MQKSRLLFVIGVCLASFGSAQPLRMETFGDSLTAGFLADTSLRETKPFSELGPLLEEIAFGFIQKDRTIIQKYEAHEKAWPHFLAELLRQSGEEVSEINNFAVSGSRSSGMLDQVKSRGKVTSPVWAFFFVGHNDLCHVKSDEAQLVEQYRRHLEQALQEWERNHQDSVAFLIPVGPIHQLYPVLENHTWLTSAGKVFYCQDAWMKYFPYCPSFYVRYKRGELENYLKPRVDAMNQGLEALAQSLEKRSPKNNAYLYLESEWPLPLMPDYFALDCYHIAGPGQRVFAKNVYEALKKRGQRAP